jgi:glycosyltransferase involved in cell wall biosynthesis
MRICFYADMSGHANWLEMFEKVEFYRVDIALLRALGHDVVLAGSPRTLDRSADLYFCWWWGHAPTPIALGKLRRKPVIVTGAFDYSTCRTELPGICYLDRPAWQKLILRTALRFADRNLFISRAEFDEVTAALPVHNPICAPLAVDTQVYCPAPATLARNFFFSVAWSSKTNAIRKGLPQTIKAFAIIAEKYPDICLVLAGKHGDGCDELKMLAWSLGVGNRVEFPGMISDTKKIEAYRSCIAYVQPTLYEGFGHAIAEAISCGTHVVSSARGAVPEVAGEYATCVDPHDLVAIANAMANCIDEPRTEADAQAAHAWIEANYSMGRRAALLTRILSEATI